jgi:trimeric autotransporter adhesin
MADSYWPLAFKIFASLTKHFRLIIFMRTKIYVTWLLVLLCNLSNAATFTSATSGDWHTPSTWTVTGVDADGIPDADDDIIISTNQNVDIIGDAQCASIILNAATTNGLETSIIIYDPAILTVQGNVSFLTSVSTSRLTKIYISDGAGPSGAQMIVNGNLNMNASANIKAEIDMTNGSGVLEIKGNFNLTHANARGTLSSSTSSTVIFSGTGTQTFPIGDGSASANKIAYRDIEINNTTGTVSIQSDITNIVNTSSIAGSITIMPNSAFNNGSHSIAGNTGETFELQSGARLIMTGTSGLPSGFTHSINPSSTIEYAGDAQNISALNNNQNYGNLSVSNGNTKTITEAIQVAGTLTLSGTTTLASGGNLTLLSNASGTARIAAIPSGASITGDVTVQRFIPASLRAYRYLSSPVNNSGTISFSQLIDDTHITGTGGAANGFDNSPSNSPSLFIYDETVPGASNTGWMEVSNINNTVNTARGFSLFIRGSRNLAEPFNGNTIADDATLDYTGTVNVGPVSPVVNYSGASADDGWNLIGNPFASPIDWNAASGWTKTNISGTIYTYDPASEVYATWDGANSINGGSRYIASGQAFFIKTTDASPAITFDEDIKVGNAPANFFRTSSVINTLRITIQKDTRSDETVIDMNASGSSAFSYSEDALKLPNSKINVSTLSSDQKNLVINRNGTLASNDTIWVNVSGIAGNYSLQFSGLSSFIQDPELMLIDLFTNTQSIISENFIYHFDITSDIHSYGSHRFALLKSSAPLPVTLIKFSGKQKDKTVELNWSTATEIENDHFTIERSNDGVSFEEIIYKNAAVNGNHLNNYQSHDLDPLTGLNYYRLRSHDHNGSSYLSKVISVEFSDGHKKLTCFPNPVNDQLTVVLSENMGENCYLEVVDLNGSIISSMSLSSYHETVKINTSDISPGIYLIHIKGKDSDDHLMFTKN